MKNRNRMGFLLIIMVLLVITFVFGRMKLNNLDESMFNKNWYYYNHSTGYYDILYFKENSLKYYKPLNINDVSPYDSCTKYTYDRKNNILNLNCDKQIKINKVEDKKLSLEIDGRIMTFFTNINESKNYEFELYYGKSISSYKKDKSQAKEFIKINYDKLNEIINGNEYSKVVFIGNKCTSIECALGLDVMEKWISTTENVFYYEAEDINEELLNNLNNIDPILEKNINFYNNIHPLVLIFRERKLIDYYYIECNGFNCAKYYKNEFN